MKNWQMYYQILKLKALGFRRNAVKKKLEVNPRTVAKYCGWKKSMAEKYALKSEPCEAIDSKYVKLSS